MSPFPPQLDTRQTLELVRRLKEGDPGAWDELYARYRDPLLFAIRNGMGARLRAVVQSEDILQSVAVDAFRAMPAFEDRGQGSLKAFLHRLVQNKLRDRGRAAGAQKRSGGQAITPSVEAAAAAPEPAYLDADRYGRLERALAVLPDDMREIVVLRQLHGLSSKEAATRTQRSDDAARKLYSRAMARLTMLVGDEA